MQEQFKKCNLPYIKQIKISLSEIDNIDFNKLWFPCFIKPIGGNASIGVALCHSKDELLENLSKAIHTLTAMSNNISEYIIQEVITGEEVFVDTFSINGKHFVSSVQTIHKESLNGTAACYRYDTLVYDQEIWDKAVNLVKMAWMLVVLKMGLIILSYFYLKIRV